MTTHHANAALDYSGVAAQVLKSHKKCKICSSPHRDKIDNILARRSKNLKDETGKNPYSIERCLEMMADLGIVNPTLDNVKTHWGPTKHSYVALTTQESEKQAERDEWKEKAMAVFERVLGPAWETITPTPEQLLELQRALFPIELLKKIATGQPLGITWDQLDRGINTSTRRAHEEKVDDLIGSLAGAIGMSALKAAADQPKQIPEVIDAEVVSEDG